MISPVTDVEKWSRLYKIQTKALPCPCCKAPLELTKPIAFDGYRGLSSEVCVSCGVDSELVRVVPVDRKKLEMWESLRF